MHKTMYASAQAGTQASEQECKQQASKQASERASTHARDPSGKQASEQARRGAVRRQGLPFLPVNLCTCVDTNRSVHPKYVCTATNTARAPSRTGCRHNRPQLRPGALGGDMFHISRAVPSEHIANQNVTLTSISASIHSYQVGGISIISARLYCDGIPVQVHRTSTALTPRLFIGDGFK
jgi:hypothetical protein